MRPRSTRALRLVTVAAAAVLMLAGTPAVADAVPPPTEATHRLTNLDHLDFLLDSVPLLPGVAGHTTFRQQSDPTAQAPWVYANHNADGSFTRVGGGAVTDAAKGWYGQGAFDADDIARAAVVYLTDWQATGSSSSRQHAYQLLRELTYLQTASGPNAGNVVLWQQSDGTLNPTPTPADSPNPSDSAESFWTARTIWALGVGAPAFRRSDPSFAAFLTDRLHLALSALQRGSLAKAGTYVTVNGARVPAWLLAGGTNATAEAVLGLAAYSQAYPRDRAVRSALGIEANGIAAMVSGGIGRWPFGAILPDQNTRSLWSGWGGLAPAALAEAGMALHRPALTRAAIPDVAQFTAQLLAGGGPDQAWSPTPFDTTQIAYGTDSLVESLLDVADATGNQGLQELAGVAAAWYFGANAANTPVYDPSTGVCADGISGTGQVNLNCGAESAIHTQLSMLALDAHPAAKTLATSLTQRRAVHGITVVEAEDASLTGAATVITPAQAWTGTANWSGGAYVQAGSGSTLTVALPELDGAINVYPVVDRAASPAGSTQWSAQVGSRTQVLGRTPNGGAGPQGISPTSRVLLPLSLARPAPPRTSTVTARVRGLAQIDAVLIQPVISELSLSGPHETLDLYVNGSRSPQRQSIRTSASVRVFDSSGRRVHSMRGHHGSATVRIPGGGFAIVTS